jgi:hypothetical protein
MTVNLKPIVEFLLRQPDFPIIDHCLVSPSYNTTPIYPPIGIRNFNSTNYSLLTKWIADNEQLPAYGSAVWAFDYADLFARLFADPTIPIEIKQAIETHNPEALAPERQAARIIDDFIVTPFFLSNRVRLIQVYIVLPPGGSQSPIYSRIIKFPITE